jgi:hypothetical protein
LSITYKDLTSGISKDLLSQLIPKAGLPEWLLRSQVGVNLYTLLREHL